MLGRNVKLLRLMKNISTTPAEKKCLVHLAHKMQAGNGNERKESNMLTLFVKFNIYLHVASRV